MISEISSKLLFSLSKVGALEEVSAISKNPDQLAEVSAEVSASFAEVSAVHSKKLPRFTRGNLHEISNKFLRNLTV